jgi:hypothetical protein
MGIDPSGEAETLIGQMTVSFISNFLFTALAEVISTEKEGAEFNIKEILFKSFISGLVGAISGPFFGKLSKLGIDKWAKFWAPMANKSMQVLTTVITLGFSTLSTFIGIAMYTIDNPDKPLSKEDIFGMFILNFIISSGFSFLNEGGGFNKFAKKIADAIKNKNEIFYKNIERLAKEGVFIDQKIINKVNLRDAYLWVTTGIKFDGPHGTIAILVENIYTMYVSTQSEG